MCTRQDSEQWKAGWSWGLVHPQSLACQTEPSSGINASRCPHPPSPATRRPLVLLPFIEEQGSGSLPLGDVPLWVGLTRQEALTWCAHPDPTALVLLGYG